LVLLARITIVTFDGFIILVKLAIFICAHWFVAQVIVGCINHWVATPGKKIMLCNFRDKRVSSTLRCKLPESPWRRVSFSV
jgi:hypothetical protein